MTRTETVRGNEPIWTRDFVLAGLVNVCWSLVYYMLVTSMAVYAVQQFQASEALAGLAASMFVIGALVVRLFIGNLLDVVGRNRILRLSFVVSVLACLAYLLAGTLPLLLAVRLVHGIAFGAGATAVIASVQMMIPSSRRSEGTGMFGLSTTLSTAVGPFLAATLVALTGAYSVVFWTGVAISLAGLGVAVLVALPEQSSPGPAAPWWRLRAADVLDATTLPIGIVVLVVGVAYSGIVAFLASFALAEGIGGVGTFFVVYAVAVVATRLVAGRVQDRMGDNAVMVPALIVFAFSFVLLAAVPTWWGLLLAGVLAGLGYGTLVPAAQVIAVRLSPMSRISHVTSTYFLLLDAGVGIGPVLLGLAIPVAGYRGVYLLLTLVMLACVGLYAVVHGRRLGGRPDLRAGAGQDLAAGDRFRVLVGVDGSADGLRAALYAMRAARLRDCGVRIVSVADEGQGVSDWGTYYPAEELKARAQQAVDRAGRALVDDGFPDDRISTEVRFGRPAKVLVGLSAEADLVVLGRRSERGLDRMFVGSTSVTVAAGTACPVVVISAASNPAETGRFGVVAVAVGSGEHHEAALAWAFQEAVRRGSGLRVVHVLAGEEAGGADRGGKDATAALEAAIEPNRALHPQLPVDVEVAGQPVSRRLLDITEQVDLLVLGTHRAGAAGLPLGGLVRGILAHARCPVVLTHPR